MGKWYLRRTDIDEDVNHRMKVGWLKWHQDPDIISDKSATKAKRQFYRTAIQPTMLYSAK